MNWLTKIISRIAEEVHNSKIQELEKRVAEMEKDQRLNAKVISSNEGKIKELEQKVWNTSVAAAKAETSIKTLLFLQGNAKSNKTQQLE